MRILVAIVFMFWFGMAALLYTAHVKCWEEGGRLIYATCVDESAIIPLAK